MWRSVLSSLVIMAGNLCVASCGDDGGASPTDAAADSAVADASTADADTRPDAFDPCPGMGYFAGEYIDWDSSLASFRGVALADMVERGNVTNTDQTSPNGRWEICVALGADTSFDVSHADYLDLIIAMDTLGHSMAPSTVRGLKPARLSTLFSAELSAGGPTIVVDGAAAQVQVDLRRPNGDPVLGATVALGAAYAGAFSFDASHVMQSGATTTADGTVFFANVDVSGTTSTVTVTAPGALSCVGPEEIPVVVGTMTALSYACD